MVEVVGLAGVDDGLQLLDGWDAHAAMEVVFLAREQVTKCNVPARSLALISCICARLESLSIDVGVDGACG